MGRFMGAGDPEPVQPPRVDRFIGAGSPLLRSQSVGPGSPPHAPAASFRSKSAPNVPAAGIGRPRPESERPPSARLIKPVPIRISSPPIRQGDQKFPDPGDVDMPPTRPLRKREYTKYGGPGEIPGHHFRVEEQPASDVQMPDAPSRARTPVEDLGLGKLNLGSRTGTPIGAADRPGTPPGQFRPIQAEQFPRPPSRFRDPLDLQPEPAERPGFRVPSRRKDKDIPVKPVSRPSSAPRDMRKIGIDPPPGGDSEPDDDGSRRTPSPRPSRRRDPRRPRTVIDDRHRQHQRKREREAARPIIIQGAPGAPGGAGGGGGGGSSGAAAAAAAAAGAAGAAGGRKPVPKPRRRTSGITKAKKRYTDQRKLKLANMRALKSKRIREFAAKTKKMAPKQRLEARKAFKKKAEGRFREFKQRFPVARGLKDLRTIQQLTRKLEGVRMAD